MSKEELKAALAKERILLEQERGKTAFLEERLKTEAGVNDMYRKMMGARL